MRAKAKIPEDIYELVSEITGKPKKLVREVVEFQYAHFLEWTRNPYSYIYKFKYMGSVSISISRITQILKKRIIPSLRENPTPELIQEFRFLWILRKKLLNQYYKEAHVIKNKRAGKPKRRSNVRRS